LPNQSDAQLLSKASYVVNVILDFADIRTPDQIRQVAQMSIDQRDKVFEKGFCSLFFSSIFPEQSTEEFEKRRVGELSYVHVYDLAKNFQKVIEGKD
jgi:hypothetical protein